MQSCNDNVRAGTLVLVCAIAADTRPDSNKQALIFFMMENQTPHAATK